MLSTVISNFQTQLINKLQFKASSKVSIDALLFKTFKFFDLYNNGYLQRKDFFKAIAKCGVVVQTSDLDSVFNYYDTHHDGKIVYKEFVQNLLFRDSQSGMENKSTLSEKGQSRKLQTSNPQRQKIGQSQYSQAHQNSPPQKQILKKSKIEEIYNQSQTPLQVTDYLKKQIRNEGIIGLLNLAMKLKITDPNKTHKISSFKLHQALSFLSQQQIKQLLQQFNPTPNGQINYGQLIYNLRGNLEPERESLINQTFQMLDHQKAGQFQIKRAIEAYNAPNKNQFVKAIDLFCNFQGIDDGYLTDQDFKDLLEFISFAFPTNQGFRRFILKGYFDQKSQSNKSHKSRSRQFDRQSSQNRYQQFQANQFYDQPVKSANMNADFRKNKQEDIIHHESPTKKLQDYHVYEDHPHQKSPDQQSQKQRSVSRHSVRSNSQVMSSNIKQVESIILRIKKRLASKGSRGFLTFQKALKNADTDCDYCINLQQFKKVIKEQRIDITNTESNIIFDVFDEKKHGLVNFQDLVYTIKGQTPAHRQQILQRIWKKVSKGNQSTTFTIIKQTLNLRVHPDIQNGKKYQEQILNQIRQTILMIQDLNGKPRKEEISKDQFIQFLQNVSLSTPEDQLFESLATNVWRIEPQNRIQDQYAGSRKLFDPKVKGYLIDHHRYAVNGGSVTQNAPFGTYSGPTNYTTEHRRF